MLNLNLLAPNERAHLADDFRRRAVVVVGGALVSVFLISLSLLLPTIFLLAFQKSDLLRALELERQGQERSGLLEDARRIRAANELAATVASKIAAEARLTPTFQAILERVPDGVTLSRVGLVSERREMTVKGLAATRAGLLAYIRALEADTLHVASVISPISNVIRESDIRFSLTVTLR